jgi:hypothetical protein
MNICPARGAYGGLWGRARERMRRFEGVEVGAIDCIEGQGFIASEGASGVAGSMSEAGIGVDEYLCSVEGVNIHSWSDRDS